MVGFGNRLRVVKTIYTANEELARAAARKMKREFTVVAGVKLDDPSDHKWTVKK
ncbi:hypothetical protein P9057_08475 [Gallibacterium anatis]|uniref:hypothetical protein n=1 Tax=Gallibacterium anatis TaxID=750 RepID=UPI0030075F28